MPGAAPYAVEAAKTGKATLTPLQAMSNSESGYGAQTSKVLAKARAYRQANPSLSFINKIDDKTLTTPVTVTGAQGVPAGAFDQVTKRIVFDERYRRRPDIVSGIIDHEVLHFTQQHDSGKSPAHPPQATTYRIHSQSSQHAEYEMQEREIMARMPRINRAWVNAGNLFPENPAQAARMLEHFGIRGPGAPVQSNLKRPINYDHTGSQYDVNKFIDTYLQLPAVQKQRTYDRLIRMQPGLV